ncbi:imidazolonepropionase-like amidohydrolase [Sphingomonas naasensis]|uniref:Amidohydrolase family protein n=1 Tax=Sphingomonas naasensis TaxID=1344951 RepID=A0A4S1WR52_9SPHN|nr:amidohydrolase family protein [Sphingomonas naasensis]NIJ18600.1 imidazolonepropionase-like amidohydrolase [Sphingomonas naasensis]TGX45848.1 amidohydrolase family protein [Sphingomonas naasensis]
METRRRVACLLGGLSLWLLGGAAPAGGYAPAPQQNAAARAVLIINVRLFTGGPTLSPPSNVLVLGNAISRISRDPIALPTGAEGMTIDGGGRTLMPGLIDAHWHTMLVALTPAQLLGSDAGFANLVAGAQASAALMRGFTTIRDLGGPAFSLKRAIDSGLIAGPRIYPSGAMITITGGHGDFRQLTDLPRTPGAFTRMELLGGAIVADSPDEVRMRAREQLMQGASQVKLTAGGGVSSPFSPLDVSTFTEAELRGAVEAAENWGTYVTVHAYTPAAIQRAIAAGVKCIEHAHLMDEATARMMAARGIWLSTQPFLDDEDATPFPPGSFERGKQLEVIAGTDRVYQLARKYRLKLAFGTDILFAPNLAPRQTAQLPKLKRWFSASEILSQATAANGELLRLSGPRNPYPGKIGVIEQGAYADLLLVEGNPIDNIDLLDDPERNFRVIMKDGRIYKNTLTG